MTDPSDPSDALAARAADPSTPPAELAELAYVHEHLRAVVAANPSAYPELVAWAREYAVDAAAVDAPAVGVAPVAAGRPARWLVPVVAAAVALVLVGGGVTAAAVGGLFGGPSDGSSDAAGDPGPLGGADDPGNGSDGEAGTDGPSDADPQAEPIVAEPPSPVPTVLILDASGSMVRDVPEGGTRMEAARAAATAFADAMPDGAELGLTVFGTGTGNSDAEQAAGCVDIKTVLPVAPFDREAFKGAVAGIVESGFTPIGPALRHAAAQLPATGPATIVLVSDGVDTCAPPPSCDVATELRAANPELTIQAIGFAVDADEAAGEALSCVAAAGGGEYYAASNAAQLAAKLRLAADPGSTVDALSEHGFNDLRIGMSLSQAEAMAPGFELGKVRLQIQYAICDDAELAFRDGVLVEIRPTAGRPTADGLVVDDPIDRATVLYGAPIATGNDAAGEYSDFAAAPGSRTGYRVYAVGGRIVTIIVCLCGPRAGEPDTDVSNWVISFDGIGPLTVAMTPEEAAAYGEVWPKENDCDFWSTNLEGARVAFIGADGAQAAFITISAYPVPIRVLTDRGVGLGSSMADVRRAYPEATFGTTKWGAERVVITDRSGRSILFVADVDRPEVTTVAVGSVTTLGLEYCG